jgi:hypothetical protein
MADNDHTSIEELVRRDIQRGLAGQNIRPDGKRASSDEQPQGSFTPISRSNQAGGDDGILYANAITGGAFTAVEWAFQCQHTAPFAGVPPTYRELTIYGVTIVRQRGEKTTFRRYVDWSGVMSELGVTASFRPAYERINEIPNIRITDVTRVSRRNRPTSA